VHLPGDWHFFRHLVCQSYCGRRDRDKEVLTCPRQPRPLTVQNPHSGHCRVLVLAARRIPRYLLSSFRIQKLSEDDILSLPYKCPARIFVFAAVLLFATFASAFAAAAIEPEFAPFSPDAAALYRRVSQIAPPPGVDVLLLEYQVTMVFDAEGKAVRSRYFLYRVLTQRGAEGWGDIAANWEPWHEQRPTFRARVITSDNSVHALDASTITDAPARENTDSTFTDRRVMRAPLPAVAPGSLVEEEVVSTEVAPYFSAGTVERFYLGASVPVQHTRLVLDAPESLPLRYDIHLLPDLKPQRNQADGRVQITFDYGFMESRDDADANLPNDVPAFPSVTISTGESWEKIADEYGKTVDKQITGADLRPLVSTLIAGKKTRYEKAAAILQYLDREVRYTGVEFGESALVPHSPTETLARKYGDCKDKSSLLIAMLRTANIPAYIALLSAGSREEVAPTLPGFGMFDHAIVYIPGETDFWVDATDPYARLGDIPTMDQGRLALVVRPGSDGLTRTPSAASSGNVLIEKREIYLAENGPARIIETSQPHGSSESWYRREFGDKQNKTARENLATYVKSQYLAEKLDRMDSSDPTDLSKPFELVLQSDRAKRGSTDLNIAAAGIRVEGLFSRLPSDLREREKKDDDKADRDSAQKPKKKRTADYQLPEAFVTEWQYTIVPPAGFVPKPLPASKSLSLGPATLTEEFSFDKNNVVHATLRFDTVKRRFTVSEASDLRENVVQVIAAEPILIYFEPLGQALINQGKVREGLKSYRELVTLHPKESVHHLQMAEALLAGGLGETARAEARSAVSLEPSSALAQKSLANILEYDLVGRKFRPGSDYAGAEAAFRAAEKLDPDDKTIVANLAVLLEHDRWGLRYGPGARLKEAIAEYRKLKVEELAQFGMQNNIVYALFYNSQFAEAKQNIQMLNPKPLALLIACEAALHGSQSALAEARKLTSGEEQFKQIADSAGEMVANLRLYSAAADLREAGASGDNASEIVAYAALYRKTKPHEQLVFGDDPIGVTLRLLRILNNLDATVEQVRVLSSRNGKTAYAIPALVKREVELERHLVSSKARRGDFAELGRDVYFTRAQPNVQGDDKTGYKVTCFSSSSYKLFVYVVKEDGQYKILGTSRDPAAVALEVLDRITANDLSGARILLDWLREDRPRGGGDDPLEGEVFPKLWTKGKQSDAANMKMAAATLLTRFEVTAQKGIQVLDEALNSSSLTDTQKLNIQIARFEGYSFLTRYAEALLAAEGLAREFPESDRAFLGRTFNLRALGRIEESDRIATERLKLMPGDRLATRALAYNATARGDYAKAHALDHELFDKGKAESGDLNNIGWTALFTGKIEPADFEFVLKASQLNEDNSGTLHTLGCLYAASGRTKDAREVLIQSMDAQRLDDPNSDFWYAFGLLAEQYGERDTALANYARVTKPEKPTEIPNSSYYLAQERVRLLLSEKR